ncbi:hypothetical protein [Clavibacter sp. MX14-G9D]|uniref:hypothetical protein n=1 Tax=Clavibacter sp. MX14-G9D TaxID=3064656 RepID=UPI00293F22E1|nr:hypothetical protein [Clavibacter sp. MX14-G9D]
MRLPGPATTGEALGALQSVAAGTEITCMWTTRDLEAVKDRVRERGFVTAADRMEALAIRDASNAAGAASYATLPTDVFPWAHEEHDHDVPAAGTRVGIVTEQREGWIVQPSAGASPWIRLSARPTDHSERAWHVLLDTGEIRLYLESVLVLHAADDDDDDTEDTDPFPEDDLS